MLAEYAAESVGHGDNFIHYSFNPVSGTLGAGQTHLEKRIILGFEIMV
jgi:hypothetical protein